MAWNSTPFAQSKTFTFLFFFTCLSVFVNAQTIFSTTDVPVSPLLNDGQPIQVGMKFQSSQNGFIRGIRYYKGSGSTGTRIGQLWTIDGTLIASEPFSGESSEGWQEVAFDNPVAISSNTTYVAALFSGSGDYAITKSYFTQPKINGPLKALADVEANGNGVFTFSSIPMFPLNSFQASNYWVDVVFSTDAGPDVYPPTISSVTPASASTGNSLQQVVSAIFNEDIDVNSVNTSNFIFTNVVSGATIPGTVAYNASTRTATFTPSIMLAQSTTYRAVIKGGNTGIKDTAGNALTEDYSWRFTTVDRAFRAPTEGYGGPILVVNDPTRPFSNYIAEILRAEGINEFSVKDIASFATASALDVFDVIIIGEMSINATQASALSSWVQAGGTLIAFKPSSSLNSLMGLTTSTTTISNKYLKVNTAAGPGAGIVADPIQFHGTGNIHTLNGATTIATFYSTTSSATAYPAVTTRSVGTSGGKAIAFLYDLPRSIAYTRQGNPAWAGQERDGQAPIRSDDLFFGQPANTGADWIDFTRVAIPQADEQQRLLANIIIQGSMHRKPLPRLWYLPKGLKAAIVMTGDDHAVNGTAGRFNHYLSLGPNSPEDVADWNAIRSTSYIYPHTPISNAQAVAFEAQGFEIALHPTTGCTNFTESSLTNDIASQTTAFTSLFPGLRTPTTNRTHCLVWSDWATQAKVEATRGIRLDANYYYWPGSWIQNRPGMFTGSGMPMRFADTSGAMIDCYQLTTQMTDESGIDFTSFCNQLLDKATGPEGFYGTFCANMHNDSVNHIGSSSIIASAMAHKVPVISSKQLLTWLDGRNNIAYDSIRWSNNKLYFTVYAPSGARNAKGMLPRWNGSSELISVTLDGVQAIAGIETIKGIPYVFFDIAGGTHAYIATYSPALSVTTQPVSQAVCTGAVATFTSTATGNPAPAVQWQQSSNGTDWTNITGANTTTLSVQATSIINNRQYRAMWTNTGNVVYSSIALLTVKPVPALSSTLVAAAVNSGALFTYNPLSTVTGTTFTWSRAQVIGITNAAASGTGSISETLVNNSTSPITVTYRYELTAAGCTNVQNVTVTVLPKNCTFSSSITATFNSASISAGRYIWFSSVFNPADFGSSTNVNFYITGGKITYSVNNQLVTLSVPDARIRFSTSVSTATTSFSNGKWETVVPMAYSGNVFMSGLSYKVPVSIPGGKVVTWSANIETDKQGASIQWKWTASVYSFFTGNAGLSIKPVDGLLYILSPLLSTGAAGTPQNYSLYNIPGAMGSGLLTITNTYTAPKTLTCPTSGNLLTTVTTNAMEATAETFDTSPVNDAALRIVAMPNPGVDYFTIQVNGVAKEPVTIRIIDMFGQVIERHDKLNGSSIIRIGHKWPAGNYFAEVTQGQERKVIKLIKL